jgi:hypothetical protein
VEGKPGRTFDQRGGVAQGGGNAVGAAGTGHGEMAGAVHEWQVRGQHHVIRDDLPAISGDDPVRRLLPVHDGVSGRFETFWSAKERSYLTLMTRLFS